MTLAESLDLPPGWKATRFQTTIEMNHTDGSRCALPVPYNPMSKDEWIAAAKKAIAEIPPPPPFVSGF